MDREFPIDPNAVTICIIYQKPRKRSPNDLAPSVGGISQLLDGLGSLDKVRGSCGIIRCGYNEIC